MALFFIGCKNKQPSERKLIGAAAQCNVKKVQALINSGVNIDLTDQYGYTALIAAVQNDNHCENCYEVVSYLINQGAKIDNQDIYGNTALYLAVMKDCADIVNLLIKNGVQIDGKNSVTGETPLFSAVSKGNVVISEILLKNKANPNIPNIDGNYPLHQATAHSLEMMSLLLKYGADPNVCDKYGFTVLHAILLNMENNRDQHVAIEKVKLLLHYGTDINKICPSQVEIPDSHIGFRKSRTFSLKPNESFMETAQRLNYELIVDFLKNYKKEENR